MANAVTQLEPKAPGHGRRAVTVWLWSLAFMVFLMIVIGGITRLTRSGLSITEWKPIAGVLPPMSEQAWENEFSLYKSYPEYRLVNRGMSLAEFKGIYFWEYLHRLWGRLIGLAFALPFLFFLLKRRLEGPVLRKVLFAFFLGGAQGLLGWYMVKSGLVKEPRVSHYRLAAHLLLALFVMEYLFWVGFRLARPAASPARRSATIRFGMAFLAVLSLQILWGAFTAGLRAGYGYNTFPLMAGALVPDEWMRLTPWYSNFFNNGATVQFVHRTLAWIVLTMAPAWFVLARRQPTRVADRRAAGLVLLAVAVQFLLGVFTILHIVPVALGVLHQAGAALLLAAATYALLEMRTT